MATKSLDGVPTQKAHQRENFTNEQVEELSNCINPDTGFEYFCEKFFPYTTSVKGKTLFKPI